ncbi:amino-acid N-acetyltransferase [Paenibacillus forsythiae]|uniref:Amino-acid N-acetyltransferase n=1 Tax=Paenibacillus forsythiae TaxID=365616 RepID=A0ABU3HA79_9BACL|nr:N-acetyltransferase [Paenibacillus forsythiae]MDT3426600.1 amino-acid N-acetyltransferase [Paenibacillus forsythiae]
MLAKPKPEPAAPEPTPAAICRSATLEDVEPLYLMIEEYAQRGIMLPRSRKVLERQIDQFVVAEIDGRVVGCGSLCRLGNDLVEVRSLGLRDECKGQGIGSMIVEELTKEARRQKIPKIMALTYAVSFFLKNGFHVVNKEIFPEKVWTDCVNCSKQDACDEIAVLKMLN